MNILKIKNASEILEGSPKPRSDEEALSLIHEADFVMEDSFDDPKSLFEYYYIKRVELGNKISKIIIDTEKGDKSFILKNYEINNILSKYKEMLYKWN